MSITLWHGGGNALGKGLGDVNLANANFFYAMRKIDPAFETDYAGTVAADDLPAFREAVVLALSGALVARDAGETDHSDPDYLVHILTRIVHLIDTALAAKVGLYWG